MENYTEYKKGSEKCRRGFGELKLKSQIEGGGGGTNNKLLKKLEK